MIIYVCIAVFGMALAICSNLLWSKRYGKQFITGEMIPRRKVYKNVSLFGFILFMLGLLYLVDSLDIIEGMGYLWLIAPCLMVVNNRSMFDPYYTTEIADHVEDFCLYLRPFIMDSKHRSMVHGFMWIPEPIEKKLCSKLEKEIAPVFCIGDPNSAVPTTLCASGIYATDAEWKSAVEKLASRSKLIVLCIMNTEGCIWELQHCINAYLNKTLFVVSDSQNLMILNKFLSKSNVAEPNLVFDEHGIAALYLSEDTTQWHISILRSSFDINNVVKYLTSNIDSVRNHILEKKKDSILVKPFKEQKVNSMWAHIVAFLLEPLWYIAYNRWPRIWTGLFVFYFIISLVVSLLLAEDLYLCLGYLCLLLAPWIWLSPRVSSSCNQWGSKEVTRRANIFLMKWVIAFVLIQFVIGLVPIN